MPTNSTGSRGLRSWWLITCGILSVLAASTYLYEEAHDILPLWVDIPAIVFLFPGWMARNLFSPGELGWQDWRDVVAMGLGSGIAWGTLATAFLGGWRAVRRRGTAGSAA